MARRRRWGLPLVVAATLLIGVVGGVATGLWLRKEAAHRAASPSPAAEAIVAAPLQPAPPPEAIPEAVAPIQPSTVRRLSAIPAATPPQLLAHLFGWSGVPEPTPGQTTGFVALTQCAALRRANPTTQEALLAAARAQLTELGMARRVRIAVSLAMGPDSRLPLPGLVEPLRIRVAAALDPACAEFYATAGQPLFFDLRVSGPSPWPASHDLSEAKTAPGGSLFADLVVDLGDSSPLDAPGGVLLSAQAVALYLWADETRATALGAVGLAAPDSQDVPAVQGVEAAPEATPQGGKPVSAELARRAAQTSGVELPPISTAPRRSVETRSLPPPLVNR